MEKKSYAQLSLIQISFMMDTLKGKTDFPQSRMIIHLFNEEKSGNISHKKKSQTKCFQMYPETLQTLCSRVVLLNARPFLSPSSGVILHFITKSLFLPPIWFIGDNLPQGSKPWQIENSWPCTYFTSSVLIARVRHSPPSAAAPVPDSGPSWHRVKNKFPH